MKLWRFVAVFSLAIACDAQLSGPSGAGGGSNTGSAGGQGGGGGLLVAPDAGFIPEPDDACKYADCSNVVDAVVIPLLAGSGLPLTREDDGVLCRRMALDLTGMVPTPAELTGQCVGKTPAQMADYFMNKSTNPIAVDSTPYVFVSRRYWANFFGYYGRTGAMCGTEHWYAYVRDLDDIVRDLYLGTIRYDKFARRVLSAPGFLEGFGNFMLTFKDLVKIASQAFRIFLGREALPSEAANFGNLFRGWGAVRMNEDDGFLFYPDCPKPAVPDPSNFFCSHNELGLDPANCAGTTRTLCQSNVLGDGEMVPLSATFVRYQDLSPADVAVAETPGRLMVARPEFAEAAADLVLSRYLGWWKAGTYVPNFDVPAVRAALAKKFIGDGYDIRKLDREVITSVLYTQAMSRPSVTNVPLWAFGPIKMMTNYQWAENFAASQGIDYGVYDFRFAGGNAPYASGNFANYPGRYYNVYWPPTLNDIGSQGGLIALFTKRSELEDHCAGAGVDPAATFDDIIDQAFVGLGRPASSEERTTLNEELSQPGGDGCPDFTSCSRSTTAISLCRSLFMSAQFNFY